MEQALGIWQQLDYSDSITGHKVVKYHLSLLMSIRQLGVLIMFSLHGFDAQRHISFSCFNAAPPTGTRMIRMPPALTSFAAFRAFQRFEALPSVTRMMICCRFFVPPIMNICFALSPCPP